MIKLVTIKELARECGVSIATVSRAFNPNSVIRPDTREKILKTAAEMGYRPNLMARGLKNARTQTVGMIIPSIDNYFYLDILKPIELSLHSRGYRLLVSFLQYGGYDEKAALSTMRDSHVDALIFSPRNIDNRALVEAMQKEMFVMQLFTAPYEDISSLIMDDVYGAELGTEHLLSLGCRKILYVGGDSRVEGYYSALAKAGIEADSRLISLDWGITTERVREKILSLNPDAVIAVARQAETAWRAITSLRKENRVAWDIPFIAYDDVNWVRMFDITAIAHPLSQIADFVTDSIEASQHSDEKTLFRQVIKPFLIRRSV